MFSFRNTDQFGLIDFFFESSRTTKTKILNHHIEINEAVNRKSAALLLCLTHNSGDDLNKFQGKKVNPLEVNESEDVASNLVYYMCWGVF